MVIPVATVTVHTVFVARDVPCAVSVRAAVDVPEFAAATSNVVLLQPDMEGVAGVSIVKSGRTTVIVSPTERGRLSANLNAMDDGADTTALSTVREL